MIAPLRALPDTYRNGAKPGVPIFMIDLDRLGRKIIKPVIEAAGLCWRGWHGFRRGLASNLKALGVDDLVIQRVLRHSNVEVTRQSYVKIRDEQVAAAMARLDAAVEQCTVVVQ